jgi:hypothetical protein
VTRVEAEEKLRMENELQHSRKLLMKEDVGDALYIMAFRHVAGKWPVLNNNLTVNLIFMFPCIMM